MANAKKCDRCGAFYTKREVVRIHPVTALDCDKSAKRLRITFDDWCKETALDLCPECVDKLNQYFNDGWEEQK